MHLKKQAGSLACSKRGQEERRGLRLGNCRLQCLQALLAEASCPPTKSEPAPDSQSRPKGSQTPVSRPLCPRF